MGKFKVEARKRTGVWGETWIVVVYRSGLVLASVDGMFSKRAALREAYARASRCIATMRGAGVEWTAANVLDARS